MLLWNVDHITLGILFFAFLTILFRSCLAWHLSNQARLGRSNSSVCLEDADMWCEQKHSMSARVRDAHQTAAKI